MDVLKKNKLVVLLIVVFAFNFMYLMCKITVNVIANQVIHSLKKDYTPSPYGPEFDPDKIDTSKLRKYTYPSKISPTSFQEEWMNTWEHERAENN